MEWDGFTLLLAIVKFGLIACVLLATGLSLNATVGVVDRAEWRRLSLVIGGSAMGASIFGGARFLLTLAQLNGGWDGALSADFVAIVWPIHSATLLALLAGSATVLTGIGVSLPWLSAIGGIALAASFGLTGHTQALEDPGIAPAIVVFHVVLAAFWVAAPVTIWPRRSLTDDVLAKRLDRFGALALWAAPLVVVAGVWLSLRLAGGLEPVLQSDYGKLLIAKAIVVGAALALGGINKLYVGKAIALGRPIGRAWLRRTLAGDALLFGAAAIFITLATTVTGPA